MPAYNIPRARNRKASARAFQSTGRRLGDGAQVQDEAEVLRESKAAAIDYKEEEDYDDKNDLTYDPKSESSAASSSMKKNKATKVTKKGAMTISDLRKRAARALIIRNRVRLRGSSQAATRDSAPGDDGYASDEKSFKTRGQKGADEDTNPAHSNAQGLEFQSAYANEAASSATSGATAPDRVGKVETRPDIKQEE